MTLVSMVAAARLRAWGGPFGTPSTRFCCSLVRLGGDPRLRASGAAVPDS